LRLPTQEDRNIVVPNAETIDYHNDYDLSVYPEMDERSASH